MVVIVVIVDNVVIVVIVVIAASIVIVVIVVIVVVVVVVIIVVIVVVVDVVVVGGGVVIVVVIVIIDVSVIHPMTDSLASHLQVTESARPLQRLPPSLVVQREDWPVREVHLRRLSRKREQLQDRRGL